MRLVTAVLVAGLLVGPPVRATATAGPGAGERTVREILLRFVPGTGFDAYLDLERQGLRIESVSVLSGMVRLRASSAEARDAALSSLAEDGRVELVGRNATISVASPDDPLYPLQWNLSAVDAEGAWRRVPDARGVSVAILDTGVAYEDYRHGRDRFAQAPDLTGTPFVPGFDFVDGDDHPNDEHGHGTHVAGIIAETTNNGMGTAGLAIGAAIMPLRILDASGIGTEAEVLDALDTAVANGAEVINLSFVFGADYVPSRALEEAVARALDSGATIVAAAGNDGAEVVRYPAALNGVLAVGASTLTPAGGFVRANYSNSGTDLDLLAPGGDLGADANGDGIADGVLAQTFYPADPLTFGTFLLSGTSAAAAQVSAVAALLRSTGATATTVEQALVAGATDVGLPGFDTDTGAGLLNANRSIGLVLTGTVPAKPAVYARVEVTRRVDARRCRAAATAEVALMDEAGIGVGGATVYGHFSGSVGGNAIAVTDPTGTARIGSPRLALTRSRSGCYQRGTAFSFVADKIVLADGRGVHPTSHMYPGWYVVAFGPHNTLRIRGAGLATNPVGIDYAPARPHGPMRMSDALLEPFALVTVAGGAGGGTSRFRRRDHVTAILLNPYTRYYRPLTGNPELVDAAASVMGVSPEPSMPTSGFLSFVRQLALVQRTAGDRLDRVLGVSPEPSIVADSRAVTRLLGAAFELHLTTPAGLAFVGFEPL